MRKVGLKIAAAGTVLAFAAVLGGCSSITDHRGYMADKALVDSVQPGIDNRQSVEKTLGRPTFESQFGQKDWFYISQTVTTPAMRRPRTTAESILRVRFDGAGNVAAVDRRDGSQVARFLPDGHETPTLGKNSSLLEDLFGNIGSVGTGGMGTGGAQTGPASGSGPNGS